MIQPVALGTILTAGKPPEGHHPGDSAVPGPLGRLPRGALLVLSNPR
jgi:hypothetical protein